MTPAPPPLPKKSDPAWEAIRLYLLAFFYLLPSVFVSNFALAYLLPRIERLWEDSGLNTSKLQWLMKAVEGMMPGLVFFALGFGVFAIVSEFAWTRWRRYRRPVVTVFMLLVHTAILSWITAVAVIANLAAPMLAQKRVKELKATAEQDSSHRP
jgi:hypothetical protein